MKKWLIVLAVLLVPCMAFAIGSPVIQEIEVVGCGDDATVVVSGTATYSDGQTCLRSFIQLEGQGFYVQQTVTCTSPNPWTVTLPVNAGVYRVKIGVTTANFFNARYAETPWFTVPECPPDSCP